MIQIAILGLGLLLVHDSWFMIGGTEGQAPVPRRIEA